MNNHPFFELLKKENLPEPLRSREVSRVLGNYISRSELVSALSSSEISFDDGDILTDGVVSYIADISSTDISDLPGLKPYGPVYPEHWGVGSDMRPYIQSAIDYGEEVNLFPKEYPVGASGSTHNTRAYGLSIPSNTSISGTDVLKTTIKVLPNSDIDVIITESGSNIENVSFKNFTLDGNEANQTEASVPGFGFWMFDCDNLYFENIHTLNPKSWGIRIERANTVSLTNIKCNHSAETNSDGIHFVDTNFVKVTNCDIFSAGDDGFIIEATNADVSDYSISGLLIEVDNELALPARGLLLLGDPATMSAARRMSNITVESVARNCSGGAVVVSGCAFENLSIKSSSYNCGYDLQFYSGNSTYSGDSFNCDFEILGHDAQTASIDTSVTNGNITNCNIKAKIYDAPNGVSGATIYGSGWSGDMSFVYNDVTSTSTVYNWNATDSKIALSSDGGSTSLLVQGVATNNTFLLGDLKNSTTNSISVTAGATNNKFIGGSIDNSVSLNAGDEIFEGVSGANLKDRITLDFSTNADGTVTYTHGLEGTPAYGQITPFTTLAMHLQLSNFTSTTVTINGDNTSGTGFTSGSYSACIELSL